MNGLTLGLFCALLFLFEPHNGAAQPSSSGSGSPTDLTYSRALRARQARETGERYLAAGDPGSALGYFRDAVLIDPSDGDAYLAIAKIYASRESITDVIETLSVALRQRSDFVPLWRYAAEYFRDHDRLDDALYAARQMTAIVPRDLDAARLHADLAAQKGAWAEALAELRRALQLATDPAARTELRRRVAAAAILAGPTDPLIAACRRGEEGSELRRALGRCL